eukprot:jgi/Chrzof1/4461/Cz14g14040.t1
MGGWETALIATGSVVGAILVAWPIGIWYEVKKCEKPKFTVIRPLGSKRSRLTGKSPAELRKYAPYIIAEVTVDGTMRAASSKGFRAIANYIFGNNIATGSTSAENIAMTSPVRMEMNNKGSEKIAMTSPVQMQLSDSAGRVEDKCAVHMSFVMPSKYTMETLPKPNNKDISIKEVGSRVAAVLKFRGHIRSRDVVERKKTELLGVMKEEGLVADGDVLLYQYHPPFTYGWQRRNEVLFYVKDA